VDQFDIQLKRGAKEVKKAQKKKKKKKGGRSSVSKSEFRVIWERPQTN